MGSNEILETENPLEKIDNEKIDYGEAEEKNEEILRLSKDEMNLVEHPFGSLSKEKDNRTIELRWQTQHPVSGKVLDAHWKVMGTPELGLPTANDEKVYLVAMELTREQGWPRQVHFTRRDLLRRLGWSDNDESYRRLYDALSRLSTVSIQTKNAFYHPRSAHYIDGVFHLVDRFVIAGQGPGRKPSRSYDGEPPTYLVWSEPLHQSFINGNIRSIDLDFALSLERPLSLRLFRYLDKKRHSTDGQSRAEFEIGLRELCGAHLGMVIENRFDSNLKASLEPAHQELLTRGFLRDAIYEKMKSQRGLKVIYHFTVDTSSTQRSLDFADNAESIQLLLPQIPNLWDNAVTPPSALPEVSAPTLESEHIQLLEKMVAIGVTRMVAEELLAQFSADDIAQQIECLTGRAPKNPAATLVKAIRQNWTLPAHRQSVERRAPTTTPNKTTNKTPLRADESTLELENAQLDTLWNELSVAERSELERQVQMRLGVLGGLGRAAAATVAMRRTLLRELAAEAENLES